MQTCQRLEPADPTMIGEAAKLLGVSFLTLRRRDESGNFPEVSPAQIAPQIPARAIAEAPEESRRGEEGGVTNVAGRTPNACQHTPCAPSTPQQESRRA